MSKRAAPAKDEDAMLEEIWCMCAEILDRQEAMFQIQEKKYDSLKLILAHCDRLIKAQEDNQRVMGIYEMVKRANALADSKAGIESPDDESVRMGRALLATLGEHPLIRGRKPS